jgi:L-rhamnose-H+ transport protein
MHEATLGLLMIMFAGVMNGSFAVPMKLTHRWQWEHTWLMWTIYGLFIFPPLLTFLTIPNTLAVYRESGPGVVAAVAACGAGWGISVVFIGLAVEAVGVAVSFSIMLGLSAARCLSFG